MTLKVSANVGRSPPANEDAVLPYLQREVHPVLKGVRRAVNDLAAFGWDRVMWRTTGSGKETVQSIDVQPGRAMSLWLDALAVDGKGGGMSQREEIVVYNDGTTIQTLMLDLDTGPRYFGAVSAGGLWLNYDAPAVEVQVQGDGSPLTWTVAIRALVALVDGDQA